MKNIKASVLTLLLLAFSTTGAMQTLKIPDNLNAISANIGSFYTIHSRQTANNVGSAKEWDPRYFTVSIANTYYEIGSDYIDLYMGTSNSGGKHLDIPELNMRLTWDHMSYNVTAYWESSAYKANTIYVNNPGTPDVSVTRENNNAYTKYAIVNIQMSNVVVSPLDPTKSIQTRKMFYFRAHPHFWLTGQDGSVRDYNYPKSYLKPKDASLNWNVSTGGVLNVESTVNVAVGSQNVADIGTLKCTPTSSIAVTTTMSPERLLIDGQPWQSGSRISCSGMETKKLTVKGPSLPLTPGKNSWTINFDYYVL